eukprot:2732690-Pyramimonas_sp.AAC.1
MSIRLSSIRFTKSASRGARSKESEGAVPLSSFFYEIYEISFFSYPSGVRRGQLQRHGAVRDLPHDKGVPGRESRARRWEGGRLRLLQKPPPGGGGTCTARGGRYRDDLHKCLALQEGDVIQRGGRYGAAGGDAKSDAAFARDDSGGTVAAHYQPRGGWLRRRGATCRRHVGRCVGRPIGRCGGGGGRGGGAGKGSDEARERDLEGGRGQIFLERGCRRP